MNRRAVFFICLHADFLPASNPSVFLRGARGYPRAAAMFSEDDSDEGPGFPSVGEGDDVSLASSDVVVPDLEAEFAADEECSRAAAFAADSFDDRSDSDNTMPLPIAEPTAGESSNAGDATPAPGNSPASSSSTIDVTPDSKSTSRQRIRNKRGGWATPSQNNYCHPPNPLVFVANPCLKLFKNLPAKTVGLVKNRMRQKQYRYLTTMKKGVDVTLRNNNTYSWPQDPVLIPAFTSEFVVAMLHDVAAFPFGDPMERGFAMDRLVDMQMESGLGEPGKAVESKVLKNKSILVTYNGAWGVLADLSPPPSLSVEDLVLMVKDNVAGKKLLEKFADHFEGLIARHMISQYVVSWEICTATWLLHHVVRVHGHAWVNKGSHKSLAMDDLCWAGTLPHMNEAAVEFCGGRGSRSVSASYAGAFYLQIDKIGKVDGKATILPFSGYQVKDFWITSLLSSQKISFATARNLYLQTVVRAEVNIRQAEFVERLTLDALAAREKELCDEAILKTEVGFTSIPEVELWKKQYPLTLSRYRFLVLDGRSGTGKTRFAYSLSPPPRAELSALTSKTEVPHTEYRKTIYYADCSGGLPDLRSFRRKLHKILVLDELHPKNAVVLKKIMQASNDDAIMGASPTMQHAYRVNSYKTMIVVTTNTWSSGLKGMPDADVDWLRINAIYVHVPGPLWKKL